MHGWPSDSARSHRPARTCGRSRDCSTPGHSAELDRQGRIRIPPELAALAELHKDVVLLGVQDHLELWSAQRWKEYLAEKQAQYDQIAENAVAQPECAGQCGQLGGIDLARIR